MFGFCYFNSCSQAILQSAGPVSVKASQATWSNGRPVTFTGSTAVDVSIVPRDLYGNLVSSQSVPAATFTAYYYSQSASVSNVSARTPVAVTNLGLYFNITQAGMYWLSIGDGSDAIADCPISLQIDAGKSVAKHTFNWTQSIITRPDLAPCLASIGTDLLCFVVDSRAVASGFKSIHWKPPIHRNTFFFCRCDQGIYKLDNTGLSLHPGSR